MGIGAWLVIAFCVTLIFGIILHLKSHGMIVQPRNVIKIIHWVAGYIMTVLLFVHWSQFGKMLTALKRKFAWFYADTWLLVILFFGDTDHRHNKTSVSRENPTSRIVALRLRNRHEHDGLNSLDQRCSGMDQNEEGLCIT